MTMLCSILQIRRLIAFSGLLLLITAMDLSLGQEFDSEVTGQNLSLDVYLYNTGKALVTGYVEDPKGLSFLNYAQYTTINPNQYVPEYSYDNSTGQIYAWTDGLTRKNGENWSLVFASRGFYNQCRIVFHLPGDLRLGKINSINELNYMITTSDESLLVDAHAYRVKDPAIIIEYQQPLGTEPLEDTSVRGTAQGIGSQNPFIIAAFISILAIGSAFALIVSRRKEKLLLGQTDQADLPITDLSPETMPMDAVAEPRQATTSSDYVSSKADPSKADQIVDTEDNDAKSEVEGMAEPGEIPLIEENQKEIKVSSEMAAVMETLTSRERSILETLIKHGGRMTQIEMRYETGSPKSSLSMILISLEKRKLITKREWGSTNVIELSEWFFSEKEQS